MGEKLLVERLAAHIAEHILERQRALRAEVKIAARYPLERTTPVTGLRTQELVTLIGLAVASPDRTRRAIGVEATGINACPCAQGLVRERAAGPSRGGRLRRGRRRADPRARPARDPQPARPRHALRRYRRRSLRGEELVDIVEGSMSSPIYELLKRPDELFVVEHAHLQPRFVEDSVRVMIGRVLERYGSRARGRRLRPRAPGQLRDDPQPRRAGGAFRHGRRAPRRARDRRVLGPLSRAQRLAAERRLRAARERRSSRGAPRPAAAGARWRGGGRAIAHAAPIVKPTTGHEASKRAANTGSEHPAAIDASEA